VCVFILIVVLALDVVSDYQEIYSVFIKQSPKISRENILRNHQLIE